MNPNPVSAPPAVIRTAGIAAILGALLFLAADLAYLTLGGGINDGVVGGVVGVWSCFVLLVGILGLVRLLELRAPRWAALLGVLPVIGLVGGTAFNVDAVHKQVFGSDLLSAEPFALLAFLPWGLLAPLSLILLGAMLWRTAAAPRWAAAVLTLAGLLFVAGRPVGVVPLVLAADVTMVVAFTALGTVLLRLAGSSSSAASSTSIDTGPLAESR